jgi:ferredoxin--NADP+ reductase
VPEGESLVLPAQLVVTAIGSFGKPIPGVPFDDQRGVIANLDGRVLPASGDHSGVYVAGWAKRGPTGIVGTNKSDAAATVRALAADLESQPPRVARPVEMTEIPGAVTWGDWLAIDQAEVELGRAGDASRQKLATWEVLLDTAHPGAADPPEE